MRRVVVTGMGIVSPVGTGLDAFWSRVTAGANGIRRISHFDPSDLACQIAGEVPSRDEDEHGFDVDAVLEPREQRRSDRFIHFAMGAAQEALANSGWEPKTDTEKERTGTIIATGVGAVTAVKSGDPQAGFIAKREVLTQLDRVQELAERLESAFGKIVKSTPGLKFGPRPLRLDRWERGTVFSWA